MARRLICIFLNSGNTDIVDKTASFVARNGPEFEARIRDNEQGNPKFNFLNFGDPYHAYYQHKVKDIREGKGIIAIKIVVLTHFFRLVCILS